MKRKAIERIKPKKPEGKGLTATLQELGEILILNIYQAKELLVRYCINNGRLDAVFGRDRAENLERDGAVDDKE